METEQDRVNIGLGLAMLIANILYMC